MPHRIRQTRFSWNPARESRAEAWERIRDHIQAEFARIVEVDRQRRKELQRQAAPSYARNQAMLHAATVMGLDDRQLARTYGLRHNHVHDILRSERHHRAQTLRARGLPKPPVYQPPTRGVSELRGVQCQCHAKLVDP
jgi:hypothetical protein